MGLYGLEGPPSSEHWRPCSQSQAAEHGEPKRGVLGEELVEPPQHHAPVPFLSLLTTRTGRTSSPQTATSLTCNKTGSGRGPGDKVSFSDDFFKFLRLIFNINFYFLKRRLKF